jgi:putative sigma-54 modulation protein
MSGGCLGNGFEPTVFNKFFARAVIDTGRKEEYSNLMNIHITPRHLPLTDGIDMYVHNKLSHLDHFEARIIGAHVVLWHDHSAPPKKQYRVKVHLAVPGPDIFAEAGEEDLYAAIDKAEEKLSSELRKRKTKRVDRKRHVEARRKERARRFGK